MGINIQHGRVTQQSVRMVLDKVKQRFSGWKANNLSFAGRLTLIQSVIGALPTYNTMQLMKLPASAHNLLDRYCRRFLWGEELDSSQRKIHVVSWKQVCKPKDYGGLGVRQAAQVNKALLSKLGWKIIMNDSALWAQVLRSKYLRNNSTFFRI